MNLQLREADWAANGPIDAPPPARPARRRYRTAILAGVVAILSVGGGAFWIWYTTMCGSCAPPITCAKHCVHPIERQQYLDPYGVIAPKVPDRLIQPTDPAPQIH